MLEQQAGSWVVLLAVDLWYLQMMGCMCRCYRWKKAKRKNQRGGKEEEEKARATKRVRLSQHGR
jgi:hypothetical protein